MCCSCKSRVSQCATCRVALDEVDGGIRALHLENIVKRLDVRSVSYINFYQKPTDPGVNHT